MPVGRRRFLAAVSAPLLAGCNTSNSNAESVGTPTAVPVPTVRPTPQRRPPPDLSALGVEDAPELARGHRDSLLAGPHGFTREVVVTEDGTPIRTLRVRVRSTADAEAYHFSSTPRTPSGIRPNPPNRTSRRGTTERRTTATGGAIRSTSSRRVGPSTRRPTVRPTAFASDACSARSRRWPSRRRPTARQRSAPTSAPGGT
ncbi:hypothetical protein GJ631_14355 [Natronomonas sp. CBA1123]|uniref:hypothetical protein n=1 Tax=Natronomonas sp. CBA1123 TaxID=2668070 RepID=UPI0012EA6F13|nr:hypothetical protein [Natronomonas sp. CBA1123]MUV87702.1 hypothetical protein [Natronomonas sp. CBA1123]